MKIRKATPKDMPAIGELMQEMGRHHARFDPSYATSIPKKTLNAYLADFFKDKKRVAFVAEEDKRVVGYALGSIRSFPVFISQEKTCHFDEAFVMPEFRRKGVASQMLSALVKWARSKGAGGITATVDARNKASLAAWKKLGFRTAQSKNKVEIGMRF